MSKHPKIEVVANKVYVNGELIMKGYGEDDSGDLLEQFWKDTERRDDGLYFKGELLLTLDELENIKKMYDPDAAEYIQELINDRGLK